MPKSEPGARSCCPSMARPVPHAAAEMPVRPCYPQTVYRLALLVACMALVQPGHALQLIDAVDGVAVEAIMSIKEPTRIRIEGEPITDVFGSVHASHCAGPSNSPSTPSAAPPLGGVGTVTTTPLAAVVNPVGEVVIECDRDKGEIYVRPVGQGNKPVNLFIGSASATYTLLLRRADTPADTIVIRDRSHRGTTRGSNGANQPPANAPAVATVRAMKSLLLAMATDQTSNADYQVHEIYRPVQLRASLRLTQVRQYQGRHLIGEKYSLHNAGIEPVDLSEQEFDRDEGAVSGVAIEHHTLAPGTSTSVYVIRRGEAP